MPSSTRKRANNSAADVTSAEPVVEADEAPKAPDPDSKRAKNSKSIGTTTQQQEDPELINQVITILREFFRTSIDFSTGSGHLHYESSTDELPLVAGKSYGDEDGEEEELLVITRQDGEPFTKEFLTILRPKLVNLINNEIVKATNDWLEATNYHDLRLNQNQINEFLKVFLDPVVPTQDDDNEEEEDDEEQEGHVRKGAIGFRRASGNLSTGFWDYAEPCDCSEEYKSMPKGKEKKLKPVK